MENLIWTVSVRECTGDGEIIKIQNRILGEKWRARGLENHRRNTGDSSLSD